MVSNWPHAPLHILRDHGIYMVTAGTYLKTHYFNNQERLKILHDSLITFSKNFGWELHAWAVFSNHYHFVAKSPPDPSNLRIMIANLHQQTSSQINQLDETINRKVWHQYWDTKISYQRSYLARLNYVHQNPVKHGLVVKASQYPWGSANLFEKNARKSFIQSIYSFDFNKVEIYDEF